MKIIDYTIPKKYFKTDRYTRLEARLAKFKLNKGDIIRFNEIDDKGKKTGRYFDRKIKDFHKIHRAIKLWKKKDLEKWGLYIFQLDEA